MRTRIILPDAGPLFSFASIDGGLNLLLAAGLPIVLTDYIAWEATRSGQRDRYAHREVDGGKHTADLGHRD